MRLGLVWTAMVGCVAVTCVPAASAADVDRSQKTDCPRGMVESLEWRRSEVIGFRFSLISETKILSLAFSRTGDVGATVGQVGGAVAGPLLKWRIDSSGLLTITGEGLEPIKLRKLCTGRGRTIAESDGERQVFSRAKL